MTRTSASLAYAIEDLRLERQAPAQPYRTRDLENFVGDDPHARHAVALMAGDDVLTHEEAQQFAARIVQAAGADGLLTHRELRQHIPNVSHRGLAATLRATREVLGVFQRQARPPRPATTPAPKRQAEGSRYGEPILTDIPGGRWNAAFWNSQPRYPGSHNPGPIPGNGSRDATWAWVMDTLRRRYPAGERVVRAALRSEDARHAHRLFNQLIYAHRHNRAEAASYLSTFVHECGHMAKGPFIDHDYVRDARDPSRRVLGFSRIGYTWGDPVADQKFNTMPPLTTSLPMQVLARSERGMSRGERSFQRSYLYDPNERSIGTLGFERLMEEFIQTTSGLVSCYATADDTMHANIRNNRQTTKKFMEWVGDYLIYAERHTPEHYRELTGHPQWRDLILTTWNRAEWALELTKNQNHVNLEWEGTRNSHVPNRAHRAVARIAANDRRL